MCPAAVAAPPMRVETMLSDLSEADASQTHHTTEPLADLLAQAGVARDNVIRISGPSGLAALLWFARHGYQQVGYLRPGRHPCDDGDLLFLTQRLDTDGLSRLLAQGPLIRQGGVVILQMLDSPEGGEHAALRLLSAAGYRTEHCLHGRHRTVGVVRRAEVSALREAA